MVGLMSSVLLLTFYVFRLTTYVLCLASYYLRLKISYFNLSNTFFERWGYSMSDPEFFGTVAGLW